MPLSQNRSAFFSSLLDLDRLPFLTVGNHFFQQKILVRVDFNVPISNGQVTNDYRLLQTLPTLKFLLKGKNKLILLSHLGRPQANKNPYQLTLKPVFHHLQTLLPTSKIFFSSQNRGKVVEEMIAKMPGGSILLLENSRFQDLVANQESGNNPALAQYWASLADSYVFDAFATAHRLHASTSGLIKFFPASNFFLGFLVKKELEDYLHLRKNLLSPFTVMIGGGKPASKLPLIGKILPQVDHLIICGALSYTFCQAQGYQVGNNPVVSSYLEEVKFWLKTYPGKIHLPCDFATSKKFADLSPKIKKLGQLASDDLCLDAGPASLIAFKKIFASSQTIVWNGPPGVFEWSHFQTGTKTIMTDLANLAEKKQIVLGGGDSVAAARQFAIDYHDFSAVSTGGGAFLLLLASGNLPVLETITNSN